MNIKVGKYRIKSDVLNVWIERELKPRSEKTKEISTEPISGFYKTFRDALDSLSDKLLLEDSSEDLKSALESLARTQEQLSIIVEGFKQELEPYKEAGEKLGVKV